MENKIITAKEAYDLAIGSRSERVKELKAKVNEDILRAAERGELHSQTITLDYSKPVVETVVKYLMDELRYYRVVTAPSAITVHWDKVLD